MKNPVSQTLQCWRWWRDLQSEGFFSKQDASLQIDRVILPARFAYQAAGKKLQHETQITEVSAGTHRIDILDRKLHFYWAGPVDNNLYFLIEQEFNEQNPHCYTTSPILLTPESTVIDVGACEGLFAFRLLKANQCQQVICFEPLPAMATLIEPGAEGPGISDGIVVETRAVSDLNGPVRLVATDNPDACHIEPCDTKPEQADAQSIRLDDYLREKGHHLNEHDLIKVDAEGADLSVIEGAAESIKKYRPQIAITTYHDDSHVSAISQKLKTLNPDYRFRLKGFSHWTTRPRPVLLQASNTRA